MRVLGVDPGLQGALALYESLGGGDHGDTLILDMPTTGDGTKRCVNGIALRDWLLLEAKPDMAFIELVGAMPSIPDEHGKRRGMGAASAFRFGDTVGSVRTAVQVCGIPITRVVPTKWKKHYGLAGLGGSPREIKERSRQRGIDLLPSCADMFKRVMDAGRAEAMLIAMYGNAVSNVRR